MGSLALEKELEKFITLHKKGVIEYALAFLEGIYDTYLFKDKYDDISESEEEDKAFRVASKLMWDSFKSKKANKLFNDCYHYCWERVQDLIEEDFNATDYLVGGDYIKFRNIVE